MRKNSRIFRFQCFTRIFIRVCLGVLLIPLFLNAIFAAGTLDPGFGSGGKVSFRFGSTSDGAGSAVLQPDGKIVIVGSTLPSGQSAGFRDFAVARLNSNGSLDNTFGSSGQVITGFGAFDEDIASAVVLQPDGKILAAGRSGNVFAITRYNANGILDTTFGTGGKVTTDFPENVSAGISDLFLQTDGKILVIGSTVSGSGSTEGQRQIALVRYNPDGSLDTSFGNNGKFKIVFGIITYLNGAAMQSNGNLLIGGSYVFNRPGCIPTKQTSCSETQEFLLSYKPNTTPDKKFGRRQGKEFSRNKSYGLSLQTDGSILAGGFPIVRRYSKNGRLETVFGPSAFPNQPPGQFFANGPYQLAQRPNGSIVGCQYLRAVGHDDIGVVLFNTAGQPMAYDQTDFFGADESCSKILIQPDGKVVVVGSAQLEQQGNYSFAVVRYLDFTP